MRSPRSVRSLQRKHGKRTGQRVLVVCEGKRTEPAYFEALKNELKLTGVTVDVVSPHGTAPNNVVDCAARKAKDATKNGIPYDRVWCVFDHDNHATYGSARTSADKGTIDTAVSVPCFEIWVLLHFQYSTRAFASGDQVIAELRKNSCVPDYEKNDRWCWTKLVPKRDQAIKNAQKLEQFHKDNGNDPAETSPSTGVHKLVEFLLKLQNGS